ncbi:putative DNA-directed RNA polymerase, phage-type, DNA/RNA polymerase superfamily [Helianthus anomalus]
MQAISFNYKVFSSYQCAENWFLKEDLGWRQKSKSDFIRYASEAKKPFQFISTMLSVLNDYSINCTAITQDASSSAYQIMSFLLLDRNMARYTNLLSGGGGGVDKIYDIYTLIQENLIRYIINLPKSPSKDKTEGRNGKTEEYMGLELKKVVIDSFDRKLVKSIFMPIIYGKTLMSTAVVRMPTLPT